MVKSKYAGIHIPAGCEMLVGPSVDALVSCGIIPEDTDSKIDISYTVNKVQGSKGETVVNYVNKMEAKGSTALYQFDLELINQLAGGIMQISKTAGTAVSAAVHAVEAGWVKDSFIILPGQNASGEKQSITKIVQGSTTLAAGTDYIQVKTNEGWGIIIPTASAAVTTKVLTITYGYTPAAQVKATMGSGSVDIQASVVRFKKVVNGKLFQVTLYKAVMTNGITLSFPAESSDSIPSLPVEIAGQLDPSRASGDQLLEIIDEIGVYG